MRGSSQGIWQLCQDSASNCSMTYDRNVPDEEFRPALLPYCRVLVFDLDNTLYDWVDYFAPAFRAMVHLLARSTSVSESELVNQFAEIYKQAGTTEYPFTVQMLPALESFDENARVELVRHARVAFSRSRSKRLRAYPGTIETLRWAWNSGVTIVVLTNAPVANVMDKLRTLGVLPYIHTVVAWQGYTDSHDPIARQLQGNSERRTYKQRVHVLEKPNSKAVGLQMIAADLDVPLREFAMVGDSVKSDIVPADQLGAQTFWATYGLRFDPRNRSTIEAITPGGKATVDAAYAVAEIPSRTKALTAPTDLIRYLRVYQESLF